MINGTLARLTWQQSLARRRWMIAATLIVLPVIIAALFRIYRSDDDEPITLMVNILSELSFTIIVPVMALVLTSAGLGAEIEDGTIVYLLTKPLARTSIVLTRLLVTAAITGVASVVSTLLTGVITVGWSDPSRLLTGFTVGALLGSVLYTGIFLGLGLATKRGMLIGLVYLVVWEGVLARLFAGTRTLSVRQYMLSVTDAISRADASVFTAQLPHERAYVMAAVVAVATTAYAIWRLRTYEQ